MCVQHWALTSIMDFNQSTPALMCSQNLNTNLINLSQSEIYLAFKTLRAKSHQAVSKYSGQVMTVGNFKPTLQSDGNSSSYKLVKKIEIFKNEPYETLDEAFKSAVKNRELTGLNTKGQEILARKGDFEPDQKIHTELIFLFGKKGMALLEEAAHHGYITFIYSKYIPCSGITTNINDCAVSLGHYLERHNKTHGATKPLKFVVGYEDIFCFTIPSQSLSNLHAAGIPVIKLHSDPNQSVGVGGAKNYLYILRSQTYASVEILIRNLSAVAYSMPSYDGPENVTIPYEPCVSFINLIGFKTEVNSRYWNVVDALNKMKLHGVSFTQITNLSYIYDGFEACLQNYPLLVESLFNQRLLSANCRSYFQPYLQVIYHHLDVCRKDINAVIYAANLCSNSFSGCIPIPNQQLLQGPIYICIENIGKLIEVLNYTYIRIAISLCEHQLIKINSHILYEKKMQQTLVTSKKYLSESNTTASKFLVYVLQNVTKSLHSLKMYLIFSSVEPIPESRKAKEKDFEEAQYKDRDAIRPYRNAYLDNVLAGHFQYLASIKTYTGQLESVAKIRTPERNSRE